MMQQKPVPVTNGLPFRAQPVRNWCAEVVKLLGFPRGWRFLLAGEYQDLWFNKNLLDVS
jgi:hypothetical protein